MTFAVDSMRNRLADLFKKGVESDSCSDELKGLFTEWLENRENSTKTVELEAKIKPLVNACDCDICKNIRPLTKFIIKQSQWIIGGDGWVMTSVSVVLIMF